MKTGEFRKNMRKLLLLKTAHNSADLQSRTSLFKLCFIPVISFVLVFMFSVNSAYGERKRVSWINMFENVRAYEEGMRSSGIQSYDRIQDARGMLADANTYERDARAFVDEIASKKHTKNIYAMEMDLKHFHERRLRELQQKWSRSKYLVECATVMAESVRDSNLGRLKSLMADPHLADVSNSNEAGVAVSNVAPEERGVHDLVKRSTVCVRVINKEGRAGGCATGFFVAPGIVLTNRHVVEGKSNKAIVLSKTLSQPVSAQIVAISDRMERDYALIRLDQTHSGDPSPLVFNTDARPSDKVTAWGFPDAVIKNDPKYKDMLKGNMRSVPDVVYSEGVISEIRDHAPTVTRHNQPPPVIIYSAVTSPGNSGGPLVNTKGQVVGIHAGRYYGDAHRQSGRAMCATDVIKFMREHGITPAVASGLR